MRALVLVAALAIPAAVHAGIVDIKWNEYAFAHTAVVAPQKFVEVCGKLTKGENVAWQFKASAPLNFNVHYHAGKDVVYPEKRNAVDKGEATLTVTLDQDYCWMWSNKGNAEVSLDMTLRKAR